MTALFKSLIANKHISEKTIPVYSPYDRSLIAEVETLDSQGVDTALQYAHDLYTDKSRWLPIHQRISILEKTIILMQQQQESLATEAAREGGKPLIDSRIEVSRAIDSLRVCVDCLRTGTGKMIPMGINAASSGKIAFTLHEPIGVVVAVSAFNHPLNLIVHQVGPAIAAGCPVIIKPAEVTPLSCLRFVQLLIDAGLPKGYCQAFVTNNRETSTQLITDRRVSFFSFIGSAKVGWMLRSKLADGCRCALEHGGAAPVIIAEDANIKNAIPKLAKGGFYHAGQVCVSVQRIFAHQSIAKNLAQELAKFGQQMTIGDPTDEKTDIGPLIRPNEVTRIHQWVQEAIEEGAECLSGGITIGDTTYPCTVLYNPSRDSKVSQQEIFGPVITVTPYTSLDDAIEQANALPFSFQASVFSRDLDTITHAYKNLNASAVMVNDHTAFRVDWMPFAGLKHSGLGVGGIPYTIEDMQVSKMVVLNSADN